MGKTKQILKRLDSEAALPTNADIEIFIKEVKLDLNFKSFISDIKHQTEKTYANLLANFQDHRIQSIISYIIYAECYRPELLSFDNAIGVYNISRTYNLDVLPTVYYYLQLDAKTVVQIMCVYNISKEAYKKQECWDAAVIKARRFNDYKEMYYNTLPKSKHRIESIKLLTYSAETKKQKKVVKEFIEEQKD